MQRPDFSQRASPVIDVIDVHDGDTYKFLLDAGGSLGWWPWLRLKGYSCPELNTAEGKRSKEHATELMVLFRESLWVVTHRVARPFKVKRYQDEDQTFSRYVADVWLDSNTSLGEALVAAGLARVGAFEG